MNRHEIATKIAERYQQQIIDDIFDELNGKKYDASDVNDILDQFSGLVSDEMDENIKMHFATERLISEVRNILSRANLYSILGLNALINKLLGVELEFTDFNETTWYDFVSKQMFEFIRGNDHVFNVHSSGCMLEAMEK